MNNGFTMCWWGLCMFTIVDDVNVVSYNIRKKLIK